jgi:hypothetical protein
MIEIETTPPEQSGGVLFFLRFVSRQKIDLTIPRAYAVSAFSMGAYMKQFGAGAFVGLALCLIWGLAAFADDNPVTPSRLERFLSACQVSSHSLRKQTGDCTDGGKIYWWYSAARPDTKDLCSGYVKRSRMVPGHWECRSNE